MKNPCVVGYRGQIGRFVLDGLLQYMPKANQILCFDVNETEEECIDRIEKSDFIFLCIPFLETAEWLKKYEVHLLDKIIVEQCSLKNEIYKKFKHLKFIGMHFLFRPEGTPPDDRRCVLIKETMAPGVSEHWVHFYNLLDKIWKCRIILLSKDDHDSFMAFEQALVHRVVLNLARMIEFTDATTYIGGEIIKLANRIKSGDKELYKAMQKNPLTNIVLKDFKDQLREFKI